MGCVLYESVVLAGSSTKVYRPWDIGARSVRITLRSSGTSSYCKVFGRDEGATIYHFLAGLKGGNIVGKYGPSIVLPCDWPELYVSLQISTGDTYHFAFFSEWQPPWGVSYLAGASSGVSGGGTFVPWANVETGLARDLTLIKKSTGAAHADVQVHVGGNTIPYYTVIPSGAGVGIVRGDAFPLGAEAVDAQVVDDSGSANTLGLYLVGMLG